MTRKSTFTKGLLGATALTLLAAPAFAQNGTVDTSASGNNTFTNAGETVSNTFSLTYTTGTDTRTVTPPAPTDFTVDRLVNLTVTGSNLTGIAPGSDNQVIQFAVTNLGNDTQGYILDIEQGVGDQFDTEPADNGTNISYYEAPASGICDAAPTSASATAYTAGTSVPPTGIAPNAVLCVIVTQDIPTAPNDGDLSNIDLIARTTEVGSNTEVTQTATNGIGDEDTVLADTGTGPFTGDGDNDGDASATGSYLVGAANVTATKEVFAFNTEGTDCAITPTVVPTTSPTGEFMTPGACVEYVIEVSNSGSQAATGVNISDVLPAELTFQSAAAFNFANTPTVANGTNTCVNPANGNPASGTCDEATLSGGEVPANDGTNDGVSQFVIRALVN